jgi:hypothetical protein
MLIKHLHLALPRGVLFAQTLEGVRQNPGDSIGPAINR